MNELEHKELKELLESKMEEYNRPEFVLEDPIQIPHRYSNIQDIEISAFLTATITWGNRKSIIKSANKMMELLGNSPYDFVQNYTPQSLEKIEKLSIHRTFKGEDLVFFLKRLRELYKEKNSLEEYFMPLDNEINMRDALHRFREKFLETEPCRSFKHVSSTYANSAAKRLMMMLRWLVRRDKRGVDLGVWQHIPTAKLSLPLDVHVGNKAREYGLLKRKQNDWKAVEELDQILRTFDAEDPAKYDFSLFGMGVNNK